MICIYCIENLITFHRYYGASMNFISREYFHRNEKVKNLPLLSQSYEEYGFENHKVTIIQEFDETEINNITQLYDFEKFYIQQFESDGGITMNIIYSLNNKPKPKRKSILKNDPTFGREQSRNKRGRVILEVKDNKIINRFLTVSEVARQLEVSVWKLLYNTKKGLVIKDRKFEFEKEGKKVSLPERTKKIIYQQDLNGNTLSFFMSVHEAAIKTGVNRQAIDACINGHQRTAKGFIWKHTIVK